MKNFKSMIMFFVMLLVFAFPAGTWAHSKLQSSVPAADSTATEAVQELSLSFNEKIDSTLSTLTITNDKGEKIDASEVKVDNNEMKAALGSPLESGSYTVEWKIVGLDGHPVKGNYAFQVDAPVATPDADQDNAGENAGDKEVSSDTGNETTDTEQEQPGDTSKDSEQPAETDNTPVEQPQASSDTTESGSGITLWVVIIIVLVVIGGFFAIKQSRKRR